jgi:hypothetical protein
VIDRIKQKKIYGPLLSILARSHMPRLAARIMLLVTEAVSIHEADRARRPRPRYALILNATKAGVVEDIQAVFSDTNLEFVTWPTYAVNAVANELLAPGLSHNRYVTTDPTIEASKVRYRKFLEAMWRQYKKRLNIDVVIAVNFGYYTQRELASAVESSGTPFIVLHRENFNGITPMRAEFWRTVYADGRGEFTGRKILVYNEIERELQLSSGVVSSDKVIVTGMPRFDRIHRWRIANAGRAAEQRAPQVLFFGFSRKDKIPTLLGKRDATLRSLIPTSDPLEQSEIQWTERSWEQLCAGTMQAIVNFARRRPDVRVIVKTKDLAIQIEDTLEYMGALADLPANLRLVKGGDPFSLIVESNVVVGFNTTGLLEAVAAGKPVIVPRFAEALDPRMQDLIIDLGQAADYANSPKELTEMIVAQVDARRVAPLQLPAPHADMLRRLVGNHDGGSSQRVLEAVQSEIDRSCSRPD